MTSHLLEWVHALQYNAKLVLWNQTSSLFFIKTLWKNLVVQMHCCICTKRTPIVYCKHVLLIDLSHMYNTSYKKLYKIKGFFFPNLVLWSFTKSSKYIVCVKYMLYISWKSHKTTQYLKKKARLLIPFWISFLPVSSHTNNVHHTPFKSCTK
jgi:hypothetical protein